jgi:nifR3 family TIM-barrel protein
MFWDKLKKPFFVLAPMHEVTDAAFRRVVAHYGKPDVIFTEFVSVDGLSHPQSQKKITDYYLKYDKSERPIVAQIWGSNPENFYKASQYVASLGFDGIDINMGCPDKSVLKQGGGAALIQNPGLAVEIVAATKEGAGKLPVSVKTRIGFEKIETEPWIGKLVESNPAALTVHGRTKKELSGAPVHWEQIGLAASIARKNGIKIIGNGDILSLEQGKAMAQKYELDGIMVGRAVMGNPWFFDSDVGYGDLAPKDKIEAMLFHAKIFEKELKGVKRFNNFRKHIKAYISGFPDAGKLRQKLMLAGNYKELKTAAKSAESGILNPW